MIDWFHTLPNFAIGGLILGVGLTVSTLAPLFLRWHFKLNPGEHMAKGTEESFKLFTSITLLLLAFCLVRVQGDHRNVEDLVAREATIITKLNRALVGYGGEEAGTLRTALSHYVEATVHDEWPLLAKAQRSDTVSNFLHQLILGCRQLDPKSTVQQLARSEILGTVTQLSDLREARVSASRLSLPAYYWWALACAITLLTIFGWFQSPLPKMVPYVGGVTLGVALLLTMLIATDGHFIGESQVTPAAIAQLLPTLRPGP